MKRNLFIKNKTTKPTIFLKGIILMAFFALCLGLFSGCAGNSASEDIKPTSASTSGEAAKTTPNQQVKAPVKTIKQGEKLTISLDEISETARFYPVSVDGTEMEVVAVKAPDGTVRTAFNTCQICFDSGRGYYEQSDKYLVCQNCGNPFEMSRVEVEAGGCNPWPIFKENKTVTDRDISISYEFLKESIQVFANWKVEY